MVAMPLIFRDSISPEDVRGNPDRLFLFGDNELRLGRAGQAAACRGRPNALGIATKRAPTDTTDAYWSDSNYERQVPILERDLAPAFAYIRRGGTVICPSAGLGTGLSELPARAPHTFATLRQLIVDLKRLGETTWPSEEPHIFNKKDSGIPLDALYCGRPSPLGNPFVIGKDGSRGDVIRQYDAWIQTQPRLMAGAEKLRDRNLVCWCAPLPCHCDVLRRLANPHLYPRQHLDLGASIRGDGIATGDQTVELPHGRAAHFRPAMINQRAGPASQPDASTLIPRNRSHRDASRTLDQQATANRQTSTPATEVSAMSGSNSTASSRQSQDDSVGRQRHLDRELDINDGIDINSGGVVTKSQTTSLARGVPTRSQSEEIHQHGVPGATLPMSTTTGALSQVDTEASKTMSQEGFTETRTAETRLMPVAATRTTPLSQATQPNRDHPANGGVSKSADSEKSETPENDQTKEVLDRLRLLQATVTLVDPVLGRQIQKLVEQATDPERLAQPGFRTGLAYALQDLEKSAIAPIAIAPELRTEMARLAATSPGLENERMQALLSGTPGITDRNVVRAIRTAAREIAQLADQRTPDVESRIEVLENQFRLAPKQAHPKLVASPASHSVSASTSGGSTNEPRPTDSIPTGEHERIRPNIASSQSFQQNADRPDPPQVRVQERGGFAIDMVLGKMRSPEPKSSGSAGPAYTPMSERLNSFEEMILAGRDERAFKRAERSGRAALEALNAFANHEGAGILNRIRHAAKQEPGGMSAVLSEMREGGRFADLRAQFNKALETERNFAAAHSQAAAAVGRYGQDRSALQDIIARRHDAEMLTARFERLDARIGEAASETPGRREGQNMMQEMSDKAAEVLRRAIDAVKAALGRSPLAQAAPSPSMGA